MTTATVVKTCVKCHQDVTHGRRMKDSHGDYWCSTCAREDTKHKRDAFDHCVDCRGKYPKDQMVESEGHHVCPGCVEARKRERGQLATTGESMSAVDGEDPSRRIKLIAASVCLAIGAMLIVMWYTDFW